MTKSTKSKNLICLGWRECVSLPDLGIEFLNAKIDTGARTSALHAYFVEPYHRGEELRVRFGIHPVQDNIEIEKICDARVFDERNITDSGGHIEKRYVIKSRLVIGSVDRVIELTLTNRDTMKFRMLLGRTGMNGAFMVNPQKSFIYGKNPN